MSKETMSCPACGKGKMFAKIFTWDEAGVEDVKYKCEICGAYLSLDDLKYKEYEKTAKEEAKEAREVAKEAKEEGVRQAAKK